MIGKKGFSLIEVIICIAIMGILSVSALSLSNHLKYADTKKCAKDLNQRIEIARMRSMSKEGIWHLYIYKQGNAVYYQITNDVLDTSKGTKVGGKQVKIYFTSTTVDASGGESPNSEIELNESNGPIDIAFSKSTGEQLTTGTSIYYNQLRIASEDRSGYKIKLVRKTGKHYFE